MAAITRSASVASLKNGGYVGAAEPKAATPESKILQEKLNSLVVALSNIAYNLDVVEGALNRLGAYVEADKVKPDSAQVQTMTIDDQLYTTVNEAEALNGRLAGLAEALVKYV